MTDPPLRAPLPPFNLPYPPPPDDLLTALSKALAEVDRPPRIVTFSRAPTEDLMAHAFGPGATAFCVVGQDGEGGDPGGLDPERQAVVPRFLDFLSLRRVARRHGPWLGRAAAVVVRFPAARIEGWDPATAGFTETRVFVGQGGRSTTLFTRPSAPRAALPSAPTAGRPPLKRLVIVDPCLGGGRGHYLPYALRLSEGARATGAKIVWACHQGLAADVAPPDVEVRPCFERCFFEVPSEALAATDLSPALAAAWSAVLDEFDAADTHFLVHSADAHLLRAADAVLSTRPGAASVIHLSCHTSPRRMAGRAAGDEAHRVLTRLRRSPRFDRSLMLWSETPRLGRWLAEWLGAPVPTVPYLSPTDPGQGRALPPTGGSLRLVVLGESRAAKGFLDLPDLMDAAARRPSLAGRLEVVIQNWASLRGPADPHRAAVERLRAHPFVTLIEGELDPEAYVAALLAADALLLPYHADVYGLRGSGILVEGLSRGLVALVRAGVSMEDAANEGVVIRYEDAEALAEAVERLAATRDETLGEAARRAERFRLANSPAAYVAALDRRARAPNA